ncbi:hypothetical protein EI77_02562 [Prosthecobacter fusiformis]|uniref:Conjugal transfer pilus assembly protein TraE n=1 Tax=Prosthecobacter fusiformis TaxID=48464 RepID=A0A4R7S1Y4_9BACT|nr:hypothetical protein [Prosthecobacter fusiformis]TDU71438.1 hypothetical protein EI77_02562 [Prosthecobacter fusiformis]
MASAAPKKKSAIDTLIARDQTAVFWFFVTCIVAAGCAWYLVIMAEELKARPPFVVMDSGGSYYVAPGLNYNRMVPMHLNLTDMAVEAIFDRGPEGIVHASRLPLLCNKIGYNVLRAKLATEARYFQTQKAYQTVTIESRRVMGTGSTVALTEATGILNRRSVFNNKQQTETYRFTVQFFWRLNPDIRRNKAFPSVIEGLQKYELEKISDS